MKNISRSFQQHVNSLIFDAHFFSLCAKRMLSAKTGWQKCLFLVFKGHFFFLELQRLKKDKLPLQGKVLVKWQTILFF